MSPDLVLGICVITGLSVLAFEVGRHIGLKVTSSRQIWLAGSLLLAVSFSWAMAGKLAWASFVPNASVVFWSNLMPALLSLTAGIASTSVNLRSWRRPATVGLLMLLTAGYTVTPSVRPILAPAQTDAKSKWKDDVCLQSHEATCAPSAAATLLRTANIDADETSLVAGCLTSSFGTEPLGLFRGLSIATEFGPRKPAVAPSDPETWTDGIELPNVALVQLESNPEHGQYVLGQQAEGHAIVVLGRDPRGNWIIADPAFGRTLWSNETFRQRFTGDAIYLDRR